MSHLTFSEYVKIGQENYTIALRNLIFLLSLDVSSDVFLFILNVSIKRIYANKDINSPKLSH